MKWQYLFISGLSVLLFFGGPESYSSRVYQEFWDTGHMFLFAGILYLAISFPLLNKKSWPIIWGSVTVFCLVVGIVIEIIQNAIGRSFELKDIVNDLLGGYFGVLIYIAMQSRFRTSTRIATLPILLAIVVFVMKPVAFVIADEFIMEEEFPVLADFETDYELSRWDNNLANLFFDQQTVHSGERSMGVLFEPGEYPDITLKDFPGNWKGYKSINFSIYNTTKQNVEMEFKIYDWQHIANGYSYSDRFNRELVLKPGWNDFSFLLEDVQSAPMERIIDISDIASFSLFLHNLEEPLLMYFDNLRLSNN